MLTLKLKSRLQISWYFITLDVYTYTHVQLSFSCEKWCLHKSKCSIFWSLCWSVYSHQCFAKVLVRVSLIKASSQLIIWENMSKCRVQDGQSAENGDRSLLSHTYGGRLLRDGVGMWKSKCECRCYLVCICLMLCRTGNYANFVLFYRSCLHTSALSQTYIGSTMLEKAC